MSGLEIDDTGYIIAGASLLTARGVVPGRNFTHEIPLNCEPLGRYITDLSTAPRSIAAGPRIPREFSAPKFPCGGEGAGISRRGARRDSRSNYTGRGWPRADSNSGIMNNA